MNDVQKKLLSVYFMNERKMLHKILIIDSFYFPFPQSSDWSSYFTGTVKIRFYPILLHHNKRALYKILFRIDQSITVPISLYISMLMLKLLCVSQSSRIMPSVQQEIVFLFT